MSHLHTALNQKGNNRVAKKYTTTIKETIANMTKGKQSERKCIEKPSKTPTYSQQQRRDLWSAARIKQKNIYFSSYLL